MTRMTGSFQNRMFDQMNDKEEPFVGMHATCIMYTDRSPYEVVAVSRTKAGKIKAIEVRRLKAVRTDENGMSECQQYRFESQPEHLTRTLTRRPNGKFVQTGVAGRSSGCSWLLGKAMAYRDFSF